MFEVGDQVGKNSIGDRRVVLAEDMRLTNSQIYDSRNLAKTWSELQWFI